METIWRNLATAVLFAGVFTFTACQKDEDKEPTLATETTQSITDNSESEGEFDALVNLDFEASEGSYDFGKPANTKTPKPFPGPNGCGEIEITPLEGSETGRVVTITFPEAGCTINGKTYKGTIQSIFTGRLNIAGNSVTTTFTNFYVKRVSGEAFVKIEGTKRVKNVTIEQSQRKDSIIVTGAKLSFSNGKTIEWNSNRLRTWSEGRGTPLVIADDIWLVSGNYNGKNRNGVSYTSHTIDGNPLQFKGACLLLGIHIPSKGQLEVTSTGNPTVILDFGDGSCDNKLTFQIVP